MKSAPKQTLEHDVLMRSIKILDIGYISVIYIIVALSVSKTVDNILGEFDEMKEREKNRFGVNPSSSPLRFGCTAF